MPKEYKGEVGLYLSGGQVRIQSCGIFVVQPKIRDIEQFGEEDFMAAVTLFSDIHSFAENIRTGDSVLKDMPDFQILIEVLRDTKSPTRRLFNVLAQLCFPTLSFSLGKNSIDFKSEEDVMVGLLNPFNYDDFAATIDELFLPKKKQDVEYHIDENNKLSRQLLAKIKRNRERLEKAMSNKEGGNEKISIFALYTSILSVGMRIDINVLYGYTPFQLYDAFERYMLKQSNDKFETLMTIPFADTSKLQDNAPESWIKNLYGAEKEEYNSLSDLSRMKNTAR